MNVHGMNSLLEIGLLCRRENLKIFLIMSVLKKNGIENFVGTGSDSFPLLF